MTQPDGPQLLDEIPPELAAVLSLRYAVVIAEVLRLGGRLVSHPGGWGRMGDPDVNGYYVQLDCVPPEAYAMLETLKGSQSVRYDEKWILYTE